jgi:protein transport protein SEC31
LLVGDFEAAVECCFQSGNLADALLLATCGEPELWAKTQQRYFEQETVKRPYLFVVSAVIRNHMDDLVANSNPRQWQETLAILSTYGKSDEFSRLCVALGNRLEEANDPQSASLCYMCGLSLDDSIRFWRTQLDEATDGATSESDETHLIALHDFAVKVFVILKAIGPTAAQQLSEDTVSLFAKYAQALAEQGLFVTAAKYVSDDIASSLMSPQSRILRDRLYRSRLSHRCLSAMGSAPEFPFTMVAVGASRGQVWAAEQRQQAQAQKQYEQQQQQMQAQQAQAQQQQYLQQQQQQQQAHVQAQHNYTSQQQQQTSTSYHVQTQQTSASYAQAPISAPQPSSSSDQLPAGWMALQDPNSGMMYYANQTTGETTWERPQAVTQQQQPYPMAPAQTSAQIDTLQASGHSTKSAKLASKYGDGFVSSASNPELAQQYGNVGTSNPYHGVERPGPAAVQSVNSAPVSATLNYDSLELPADLDAFRDSLAGVIQALKQTQLSAPDNRQLVEGEKSVAILVKKLARGDIFEETKATIFNMVMALVNRDYGAAAAMQTALVSSDWKSHKDWLKGMKVLIQLASRKLSAVHPPGY